MARTIRYMPPRGPAENLRPAGAHCDKKHPCRSAQKANLRREEW